MTAGIGNLGVEARTPDIASLATVVARKDSYMLPEIGLMIGVYIIARMVSFLTRKELRAESVVVKVFAGISIFVTVIVPIDLLSRGSGPQLPR
jgi:hypothetical protein